CISLFMITGHAPRSTQISATARASSSRSSSQMIVTTSPSSTEKQTSTISAASFSRLSVAIAVAMSSHPFPAEQRKDVLREALDLVELVDGAESADEVVDAGVGERADPLGDVLRTADGPPVGQVQRLRELGVVLRDVLVERASRLLGRVADVHRHLVRD